MNNKEKSKSIKKAGRELFNDVLNRKSGIHKNKKREKRQQIKEKLRKENYEDG